MATLSAAIYVYGPSAAEHAAVLEALAAGHRWRVAHRYTDTQSARPALRELQAAVMSRKLDVIMLHELSAVAAGPLELIETVAWLDGEGVHIFCVNPLLYSADATGQKFMGLFRYLAAMASDKRSARKPSSSKPKGGARKKM
jgi:hypothetical protein